METIQIDHRTHRLLVDYASRRGTSVEDAVMFLLTKQFEKEGVQVAPAQTGNAALPPFESPHTNDQFAQWLGVSIETVKRMSKRTPGRMTIGSGGRCVRWHIPTYLAALR